MNNSPSNLTVPSSIVQKLRLVQKRSLLIQFACGIVAALAVLLAAMGVAMLIDWLATLYDSRWRVVLTMFALSAAVGTSVAWIVVAWLRAQQLERVAADVDRHEPRLEERWTTVMRLGDDAAKPEVVHPAMLRRLSSEAASWEPSIDPEQVVTLSSLKYVLIGLTAVTAILCIAVVLDFREVSVLARRFWQPRSSISATTLVDLPGNIVIARGEPLALNANLAGREVRDAKLFVQPASKPEQTINLIAERSTPAGFSHRIRSVDESFSYRFRAGDGQSEWYQVDVAERPEIEAIKLTVTPPSYTRQPAKSFDKLPDRLSALKSSRIEFAVRAKSPIASAKLKMDNDQFADLQLGADGWYRWSTNLAASSSITPILTEAHGLTNRRQPKCQLIAYEDQPPVVKVLTPDDRMAVRPDDSIEITFSATDDVGIGAAELVIYQEGNEKEPVELAAIPIELGEQQGARAVQQTVDLDLKKFGTKDGAELSYEIRVREDRGLEAPKVASRPASSTAAKNEQNPLVARSGSDKPANKQASESASSASTPKTEPSAQDLVASSSPTGPKDKDGTSPLTIKQPPLAQSSTPGKPTTTVPSPAAESKSAQPMATAPAAPPTSTPPAIEKPEATPLAASNPNANSPPNDKPQPAATAQAPSSASPPTTANRQSSPGANKPSEQSAAAKTAATSPTPGKNGEKATVEMTKPAAAQPSAPSVAQAAAAKSSAPNAAKPQPPATGSPEARTASTGRQSLSPEKAATEPNHPARNDASAMANDSTPGTPSSSPSAKQSEANAQQPSSKAANQTASSNSQPNGQKSGESSGSTPQSQLASQQKPPSKEQDKTSSSDSTPSPGDNMPRRGLDVGQSASSQRMRLKVDQWAGSFEGQLRAKLEMAIDPELTALDQQLAKAQRTARGVLDGLKADPNWVPAHDRELTNTLELVDDGKKIIDKLVAQSKDTPYAFIGLQVADLNVAHLAPARSSFWSAIQSNGSDRPASVHDGWQHLGRARQLLADLRGQFERSRRDFQLAEAVQKAKKMYQVYVENSLALLDVQDSDPERYNRKLAEFELDEEYLKRLKEVLKMRQDLRAELARILGDDPRLLRRFMDNMRAKSNNLREQLADLTIRQEGLNREVRAWAAIPESDRAPMAKILLLQNLQQSTTIATSVAELQDRYQSWLPLQKASQDSPLATISKQIQDVSTAAAELKSRAESYAASEQKASIEPPAATPAPTAEAAPGTQPAPAAAASGPTLDQVVAQSEIVYSQLGQLEVSLRQLASRDDNPDVATFAGNRLTQTRRLIADSSAWIRQIKAQKAGSYTGAAEVTQYRLAMKTDELAGKLSDIEQELAGLLQRTDQSLPQPIADKARELMATLDKEAAPSQLAAVYGLHANQLPRATERQQAAAAALSKAEKLYDELMRLAITEMDKLPVQDPIASLLEDPTLDELLAQLEQELPPQELLGIPNRPSNLQIIGDWTRPNSGGGGGGGGGSRRAAANQMKQQDKRTQQKLNQAYQQAIARALKETTPKRTEKVAKTVKLADWNKLVSHLGDDVSQGRDKAPPEQYRKAIEQYFAEISRSVAEQEKKKP